MRCARLRGREGGSTLIELLAALTMVSLVLMPLTGSVLGLREHVVDSWRASLETAPTAGDADSEQRRLWRWSDVTVVGATPDRNGVGVVVKGGPRGREREIGWWVDGWPMGRSAVDATGKGFASTGDVALSSDVVLTIRAREEGGGWGVPWRVRLGPATATAPPASPGGAPAPSAGRFEEGGAVALVHLKIPGQGRLDLCGLGTASTPTEAGDVVTLLVPPGVVSLSCDGEPQSLRLEPGSVTHVFF